MFSSFQTVERVVYGRGVAAKLGEAYKRLMDSNPRKGTADVLEKLLEQFY